MKILVNQIKCLKCGDTPYSAHRHDFKYCKCGAVVVDGGMDYLRRVGNGADFEEMSMAVDYKLFDNIMEALDWCDETDRNNLGRVCAIARAIRDSGYKISQVGEITTEIKDS